MTCPICEGTEDIIRFKQKDTVVLRCSTCGAVWYELGTVVVSIGETISQEDIQLRKRYIQLTKKAGMWK